MSGENSKPDNIEDAITEAAIPISPGLDFVVEAAQVPEPTRSIDRRVVWLCGIAIVLGIAAAFVAKLFLGLIALITNIAFFGQFSLDSHGPSENQLGLWVLLIPVIGGLICGLMARFGSKAIRGHGIPEAMEQVLTNRSRIPAHHVFETGFGGRCDWHWRTVRRGRSDYRHGKCAGVAGGTVRSYDAGRAKDFASGRCGGRHGGGVRQSCVCRAVGD